MASHIIDSCIYSKMIPTEEIKSIFNENNYMQKILDVESALAWGEGKLGIIPQYAADEICSKAKCAYIPFDKVMEGIVKTEHPLLPIIKVLESICEKDAGQYLHWGTTTQDILDTAVVLQIKEGRNIICRDMNKLLDILTEIALKYRNTVMAGRTNGQQAIPITFGYKAAVWLDEMKRHLDRLEESKERLLVGNVSGAVGTYASLGAKGPELEKIVLEKLGLGVPNICWHASRDRFTEYLNILALIASTCGKIANEILNLQRTEINEVEEGFVLGRVGSSTMPHKRNPKTSAWIISLTKLVRNNANLMQQIMEQEHERDISNWRTEWAIIPESNIYLSAVLQLSIKLLRSISVKEIDMLNNLNMLKGLLLSERVMYAISEKVGKQNAHELIYKICMETYAEGRDLAEVILKNPSTSHFFTSEEIRNILDPGQYVGLAPYIVERVVKKTRSA
ncbi:MAG: adenylosuccinate lyase [Dehalobacterium sp.]